MGLGIFLRKGGLIKDSAEGPLMRVIVTIFYPALIISAVGPTPVVESPKLVIVSILTGFLAVTLGFAVAWLLGPLFGLKIGEGRRSFTFTTGIFNYGYLPVPLVIAFYGQTDGTLAILFIHNIGVDLAFWSVGVLILQGAFSRKGLYRIINPPFVALVFALLLNYSGIYGSLPEFVVTFLEYLAAIAIPLGIILAGCAIGGLLTRNAFQSGWKVVTGACLIRLGILPVLFIAFVYSFDMPPALEKVILIQAAMPAGLFPVVVAGFFGVRQDVAVRVAVSTMILSVITTPLWLKFAGSVFTFE